MAEKYEFISVANLPTTEAEEVDVLCVENGELKRKQTSAVYDLDITVIDDWNTDDEGYDTTYKLRSISKYADLKYKIENALPLKARVIYKRQSNEYPASGYAIESFTDNAISGLYEPTGYYGVDSPENIILFANGLACYFGLILTSDNIIQEVTGEF